MPHADVWEDARVRAQVTFIDAKSGKLDDIRVKPSLENRHIGLMLLASVERYVGTQGIQHLWGDISIEDSDHFDKLEYFYKKNGWTWQVFSRDESSGRRGSAIVGRIEKDLIHPPA